MFRVLQRPSKPNQFNEFRAVQVSTCTAFFVAHGLVAMSARYTRAHAKRNKMRCAKRGAVFELQLLGGVLGMLPERSDNTQRTKVFLRVRVRWKPFVYNCERAKFARSCA
jgi:hypothetical protein